MRTKFDIGVGSSCPHCAKGEIILRHGKFEDFLSCSRFPYCAFSQDLEEEDWLDGLSGEENEDSDLVFN
jgi:ssDNA-binding Zn-finger/Zn-ribbon topoisomerase 1